jgi:hypothetical protein
MDELKKMELKIFKDKLKNDSKELMKLMNHPKNVIRGFISEGNFKYFVTLTFKNKVSRSEVESCTKNFKNILKKKLFGNHGGFYTNFFAIIEENPRYHIHILLGDPDSNSKFFNLNIPMEVLIRESWSKIKSGGKEIDVQEVYDDYDLINYCLKEINPYGREGEMLDNVHFQTMEIT